MESREWEQRGVPKGEGPTGGTAVFIHSSIRSSNIYGVGPRRQPLTWVVQVELCPPGSHLLSAAAATQLLKAVMGSPGAAGVSGGTLDPDVGGPRGFTEEVTS